MKKGLFLGMVCAMFLYASGAMALGCGDDNCKSYGSSKCPSGEAKCVKKYFFLKECQCTDSAD
jgi:hypothetical protein